MYCASATKGAAFDPNGFKTATASWVNLVTSLFDADNPTAAG